MVKFSDALIRRQIKTWKWLRNLMEIMPKKKSVWEIAILKVLDKHNGIATLKNFYEEVPSQIEKTRTTDAKHDIRGYLRRLKNVKKEIKQFLQPKVKSSLMN